MLCHVDVEDVVKALGEINKTAAVHACSLVCAWSAEEVARYLETFKLYEHKTAENIQERTENDYASRLTSASFRDARASKHTAHALAPPQAR